MTATQLAQATYFPDTENTVDADIISILDALKSRNRDAPNALPHLVDGRGQRYDLPESIVEPLLLIAQSMIAGKAVTVAPIDQVLTTQQSADFLGISRPTLVKVLENGDIPFEKINRHRRVKLSDLVNYQQERKKRVREGLRDMARLSMEDGSFDRTVGLPPAMR